MEKSFTVRFELGGKIYFDVWTIWIVILTEFDNWMVYTFNEQAEWYNRQNKPECK